MDKPHIGILHYTAPPVVGGVEAVIQVQAQMFRRKNYPVTIIAGRGDSSALPQGISLVLHPQLDSQDEKILQISASLEKGDVPVGFEELVEELAGVLKPEVGDIDHLIIHNVFTKHFNMPLTAALIMLIEIGSIRHAIAWCHDFTWTSENSRSKVHPGYPWDILRTYNPKVTYVTVSARRQETLAKLFVCDPREIHLIYNGVEPDILLGLSREGLELINRLGLFGAEMILLMPVRVTRAKNIEYALRVVAALKHRLSPKLILTGPPDPHDPQNMRYFQSLLKQCLELGIDKDVHFVYQSGRKTDEPYLIDSIVVGDLFRMSDVVFMPSHREGFGMPVLEAGLSGVPVICTNVPAAEEIGEEDVTIFSAEQTPEELAELIIKTVEANPVSRFRRRVRKDFTWEGLFERRIEPLIANP